MNRAFQSSAVRIALSRRTQAKMSNKSTRTRLEILHRLAVNAWKRSASERESSDSLESNFSTKRGEARAIEKTSRRRTNYYLGAVNADLKALSCLDGSVKLFTPVPSDLVYTNPPGRQEVLQPLSSGATTSYGESASTSSKPTEIPEQPGCSGETSTGDRSKFFIGSVPTSSSSSSSMEDVMLKPILAPMKRSSSSGSSGDDLDEIDNPELCRSLDNELEQQHSRLGSFLRQHSIILLEILADLDRYDVPNWKLLMLSEISSELARAEFLLKEQVDMLSEYMTLYYPSLASKKVKSSHSALVRHLCDKFVVAVRCIRRMFCLL